MNLATCKDCSEDFDTAEMVWLKGYTCEPCYRVAVKNSGLKTQDPREALFNSHVMEVDA
jgi:hypothetical protein